MKTVSTASYAKGDAVYSDSGVILYVENVSVSFDGFNALTDLSLCVDEGSLHCIIGPNGAGKTTLLDIVTGKTKPTAGRVVLGQNIVLTDRTEWEVARLGVGRKFQKPTVFENLTLDENLELAYACAFALAGAHWGCGVRATLTAYAWVFVEGQTMTAVKIVPLGQAAGQRLLAAVSGDVADVVDAVPAAGAPCGYSNTPGRSLAQLRHAGQRVRLFRS